eukprot:854919-Alexandrium_andersonii.AAC.1
MSAYRKSSQWQAALRPQHSEAVSRLMWDTTRSATASGCEQGGRWQAALELLHIAAEPRPVLEVICCDAAVSGCEKGSQWQAAHELLYPMT